LAVQVPTTYVQGGQCQKGVPPPLKSGYFSAILLSNVKTVADGHRHAAYRNKCCRSAF